MKIKAAVLNKMGAELPYAKSKPLTIEEVELDDLVVAKRWSRSVWLVLSFRPFSD